MGRRVVITGLGVVSSLGNTVEEFWNNIINGRSGISRISKFDVSEYPSQIASEIRDFNPDEFISQRMQKGLLYLLNMPFLLPKRLWKMPGWRSMKRMLIR